MIDTVQLDKINNFSNDIIFIDGLWGTGKSLLGPIVSGMTGIEKVKIEHVYEYICSLSSLGKIESDAALWMLRTYADLSQYNNTISREVNLRWSDDSGIGNNPDKIKYIKRLFSGEGDSKVDEINRGNLALCVMSHMLMLTPELLPLAYGNRVKVIEIVRHPLYMFQHWVGYLSRFDSPREFTVSFYHENVKVPWFARDFKNEFVNMNPTEKAVLCISRLYSLLDEKIQQAKTNGLAVLDLSFEETVFETNRTLEKLDQFTNRKHHTRIASILKKQKLPRTTLSNGKGHASYGWSSIDKPERERYSDLLSNLRNNCSSELQSKMMQLIEWYNCRYPSELGKYK